MAHAHSVFDTDQYFSIDENTRAITYEGDGIPVITQGDRNSERFTFELPRYIDGHDMTKCNVVQVHFVNINASDPSEHISDIYNIDDLQVDAEDEELALCTWLIGPNETKYVGSLNFALRFACVTGDVVEYSWSTIPYTKIAIVSTIDNSEDAASNLNVILDADNPIVELEGYYKGIVQIDLVPTVTITPSMSTQIVRASSGKVLETVIVNPAPATSTSSTANYRLSGTWNFDTSRLFDVLAGTGNKVTQRVSFSNGVPGSENDSVNYTSMTFDFTSATLKFDDVPVFNNGDGVWSNGDYGTKITFDTVQYVTEEFYNLLALAADYISGTDEVPAVLQDNKDYEVTTNDDVTVIIGPDTGYDAMKKVTVKLTVPDGDSALPIEVSTEAEMTELLSSGEVNGVYKYTGETTDTYENGALYVLEEMTE